MRNLINELVQKSAQSWFGRWLRLPQMVHVAFWLSALSAAIFLPVFRYVENSNERHRLDSELSLQQQEWEKQEKILQTLRQSQTADNFLQNWLILCCRSISMFRYC